MCFGSLFCFVFSAATEFVLFFVFFYFLRKRGRRARVVYSILACKHISLQCELVEGGVRVEAGRCSLSLSTAFNIQRTFCCQIIYVLHEEY